MFQSQEMKDQHQVASSLFRIEGAARNQKKKKNSRIEHFWFQVDQMEMALSRY